MDGHCHCLHSLAGVNGVNNSRNITSVVLNSIFDFGVNEKFFMAVGSKNTFDWLEYKKFTLEPCDRIITMSKWKSKMAATT